MTYSSLVGAAWKVPTSKLAMDTAWKSLKKHCRIPVLLGPWKSCKFHRRATRSKEWDTRGAPPPPPLRVRRSIRPADRSPADATKPRAHAASELLSMFLGQNRITNCCKPSLSMRIFIHMCIYTCIYIYICVHTYIYVYLYISMYYVHICMCVYIYIYGGVYEPMSTHNIWLYPS